MPRFPVFCHSIDGYVEAMAEAVAEGARFQRRCVAETAKKLVG